MNGENDSANNKMEFVLKVLDEYEKNIGLPLSFETKEVEQSSSYEDIKKYMEFSNIELNALSIEDCANINYQLIRFSTQLQRLSNRETQREQWCDSELNRMIGKEGHKYKPYKTEDKLYCLIHDDSYAEKVMKIREFALYRITRLKSISFMVKDFAESIKNLQKVKERKE